MSDPDLVGTLVAERFRIIRRIGGGSFGEIYMGIGPNLTEVAAKFERKGHISPQLRHEYKVYRELKGSRGICTVYFFGDHLDMYNVVVMELMGPSLEDLFERCRKRFSLKTVLQIADQLLVRVHTLHEKSIIHRDIKPQNFVIGLGAKASEIYCVDFGLAKLYRDRKTLVHLPLRDGSLAGTPRYASISNHLGIAQSRRDDLESIAYMLIYFLKGKLPWQGLKASDKRTKYGLILECKQMTTIRTLCEGLPREFSEFLQYSRTMRFDEEPNLDYTRKLFRDLYVARGYDTLQGKMWDWDPPVTSSATSSSARADAVEPTAPAAAGTKVTAKPTENNERPSTTPAAEVIATDESRALERTQSAGGNNNNNNNINKGATTAKKQRNNAESNARTRGQKDATGTGEDDNESLEPKLGEEAGDNGNMQTRPNTVGGTGTDDAGGAMVVESHT